RRSSRRSSPARSTRCRRRNTTLSGDAGAVRRPGVLLTRTRYRRRPGFRQDGGTMKLELRGITKRFGPVVANDGIDLVVEPGQIHALLGENGAGKTTLMNVLFGLYQPDAGEILLDGEVQHFAGPGDAMAAGIGMVHQHF